MVRGRFLVRSDNFAMQQSRVYLVLVILVVLLVGATGKGGRGGGGGGGRSSGGRSSGSRSSGGRSGGSSTSGKGGVFGGLFGRSSSVSYSRTIPYGTGTRTFTYSGSSSRNYNSGARFYMRRTTTTTSTTNFGYSYYRSGSYYSSGYGYRMYYPPTYYSPIYVGSLYYYYPPMFYRFHRYYPQYWKGRRPRYVCRNDNAFWPLENQTSEFVDGRPPSVNLAEFEIELPDPPENSSYSDSVRSNAMSDANANDYTAINSLTINQELADDNSSTDFMSIPGMFRSTTRKLTTTATPRRVQQQLQPPSEDNKRAILSYNYFVCPDGKDPDEISCCGPSTAQYCCIEDEGPLVNLLIIIVVLVLYVFIKIVEIIHRRCSRSREDEDEDEEVHMRNETVVATRETVEYVSASVNDAITIGLAPGPVRV